MSTPEFLAFALPVVSFIPLVVSERVAGLRV